MKDLALIESRTLREEYINQVEVLDKVKAIDYMTDDMIVSVEQAADYYEVPKKSIESVIERNNDELKTDGLRVLKGKELKLFKGYLQNEGNLSDSIKYAPVYTIIPRRALLRIGMLLRDSKVATQVRTLLLNKEELVQGEDKELALKKQEIEARYNNSIARKARLLEQIATKHKDVLSHESIQLLLSESVKILTNGQVSLPKPEAEKLYTATDIAEELGTSANMVGRIANSNNIKIKKYGKWVLDKSPYSNKQVITFLYNEAGKRKLRKLYNKRVTG